MRRFIAAIALAAMASSTAAHAGDTSLPKKRWQPGAWWVAVGLNDASIEGAELDCFGGQLALGFGRKGFVKLQRALVTYEENDTTDSCDGLVTGDSSITEDALLLGVSFRSSGVFVAVGPARVSVEEYGVNRTEDSELRFELGWSSRRLRSWRFLHGVELTGFVVNNEVRSYSGFALNWTLGERGR